MKINIFKTHYQSSQVAAQLIIDLVIKNKYAVLGLATGFSPEIIYQKLIKDAKINYYSYKNIKTFNLDEYWTLDGDNPHSYRYFMNHKLFNHLDFDLENTFVPLGVGDAWQNCQEYERQLSESPIDLQILGIGTNGHIAFNEPGTSFASTTHIVKLTKETINANKRFFNDSFKIPQKAISMGINSILQAKKIILIASSVNKAQAIYNMIKGPYNKSCPASALQKHHDVEVFIDEAAASLLGGK